MAKVLLEEAKRIADTVMEEHPGLISKKWSYDVGLLLTNSGSNHPHLRSCR